MAVFVVTRLQFLPAVDFAGSVKLLITFVAAIVSGEVIVLMNLIFEHSGLILDFGM